MPVIQTARRRASAAAWWPSSGVRRRARIGRPSASARRVKVASVRPAIGRVNAASTNAAKPGIAGAKSCSISTGSRRVRPPAGAARSSRSRPSPSSRRPHGRSAAAGSRARARSGCARSTGIPSPSTGTNGAARDEVAHERAVGVVADGRGARVVGEQPLPARHVAREPVDELRRRRDVDADGRVHSAARPAPGPSDHDGRRPGARRARSNGTHAARSVELADLVAQLAAGHRDAVQRRRTFVDPVPARWSRRVRAPPTGRPTSSLERGRRGPSPRRARAGRLGRAPRRTRGRRRGASTGRRPAVPGDDPDEQDRVVAPRTTRRRRSGPARRRRRPRCGAPSAAAHGPRSPARNRGSRARDAGTRSPITRPIVARTASRSREPAARRTRTARGRARNAWTRLRHEVLASRTARPSHRRRPASAPAVPRQVGVDRLRREARARPAPGAGPRP